MIFVWLALAALVLISIWYWKYAGTQSAALSQPKQLAKQAGEGRSGRNQLANKWVDGFRGLGKFDLPGQQEVYGELILEGNDSKLMLHDVDKFGLPYPTIHGVIDHTTKLSLLDCVVMSSDRRVDSQGDVSKYRIELFPHHIIFGDEHVHKSASIFSSISFKLTDAKSLFYDFDAFGLALEPNMFIDQILAADSKTIGREIPKGEHPEIAYFTGKHTIIQVPTALGKISAEHRPLVSMGGSGGSGFVNSIWVEIEFKSAQTFSEALTSAQELEPFFSMIAGRPQRMEEMRLIVSSAPDVPKIFEVYSTMKPFVRFPGTAPRPSDLPIDPVRRSQEYSNVLADWVKRSSSWMDARMRYSNSLRTQVFDIDRLVGSANMFDILPASAVPKDAELSDDLKAARDKSRELFLDLPESAERGSILSALGRLGKSALKNKVRWRAAPIIAEIGDKFPDLNWVLDEAVNCRNHYVHGTEGKVDYAANFLDTAGFFTKTLEFVFATSDLVEAGWDIKGWASRSSSLSHPFYEFKYGYKDDLAALKLLFNKQ
ncbi:MAG: hypothetical protein EOS55_28975 [Mesorhizobium sp.]|nr:MAG: hypothetical protein EOS55_28975 [Mesorhizobium sp.]